MKIVAKPKSNAIINISNEKIAFIRECIKDKNCLLTCAGRVDGVGAQAWASLSTLIVARFLGFKFIYTPLLNVDHNDLNINKREWTKEWDDILQLKNISTNTPNTPNTPNTSTKITKRVLMNWEDILRKSDLQLKTYFQSNTCYIVKQSHDIINVFYSQMNEIIDNIQKELQFLILASHSETQYNTNTNKKRVAIHIRKGDVTELKITKRITPNIYFINLMKQMNLTGEYEFHIYSEGSIQKDFPEFKKNKDKNNFALVEDDTIQAYIHLNGDARDTFKELVSADVLVTSKSCFSYMAAILNKNTILFTKFWFPKLSEKWIELNEDGTIGSAQTRASLRCAENPDISLLTMFNAVAPAALHEF